MYNVKKSNHEKHGAVIEISVSDDGRFETPFQAVNAALFIKRESKNKTKILIDEHIVTSKQAEKWAKEEYDHLIKCFNCGKILHEQVYTHKLCGSNLFCTQRCADIDYQYRMDQLLDEEEVDYL